MLGSLRQENHKASLGHIIKPSVRMREEERVRKRGAADTKSTLGYFPWEFSHLSHDPLSISGCTRRDHTAMARASLLAGDLSLGLVPLCVMHVAHERGITSLTSPSSAGWQGDANTQFMMRVA